MLRAAVGDGGGASSAWQEWRRSGGSLDRLDPSTSRLLPIVYRSLEANRVDDPDILRLRGVYRHTWVKNQLLVNRLGDVLESLNREGIPTMVLRGAAVSMAHYRDAGARRLDDVGVLVPPPKAEHALAILRAQGWSPLWGLDPGRVLRSRHAVVLAGLGGFQISLNSRALAESVGDEDFWSGAVAVTVGRAATLAPGPTEQLLSTCACRVSAGPGALTWIADIAVILRSAGAEIDWGRFVEGVAQRRIALTAIMSLAVTRVVLDAPIPPQVITELGRLPTTARERLLVRLSRKPTRIMACVELWDMYRRHVTADGDHGYRDFLRFVADAADLPSRRAIASKLVRRAMSLAIAASRPGRRDDALES